MDDNRELELAKRAEAIMECSELYSKYEVLQLMKDWKEDYYKHLLSSVPTPHNTKI
tara:strand:- start:35 stop:202 length:168 start_codon:yes stop_codon:yes gene_type:complete